VCLPLITFESAGRLQSFLASGAGGGNVSKIIEFLRAALSEATGRETQAARVLWSDRRWQHELGLYLGARTDAGEGTYVGPACGGRLRLELTASRQESASGARMPRKALACVAFWIFFANFTWVIVAEAAVVLLGWLLWRSFPAASGQCGSCPSRPFGRSTHTSTLPAWAAPAVNGVGTGGEGDSGTSALSARGAGGNYLHPGQRPGPKPVGIQGLPQMRVLNCSGNVTCHSGGGGGGGGGEESPHMSQLLD